MVSSKSLGSRRSSPILKIVGNQQLAVLNSIRKPTTGKQLLESSKRSAPRISYADIRQILRLFEKWKIVRCLNPDSQTGRIYSLTAKGLAVATFNNSEFTFAIPHSSTDWSALSSVARSKSLSATLKALCKSSFGSYRKSPTKLRKELLESHPVSMSTIVGLLRRLEKLGLAKRSEKAADDSRVVYYAATPKGRIISELAE